MFMNGTAARAATVKILVTILTLVMVVSAMQSGLLPLRKLAGGVL